MAPKNYGGSYGTYGGTDGAMGQYPGSGQGDYAGQRQGSTHSVLRSGNFNQVPSMSSVNVWELIFIPWLLLVLVLVCFLLAGAHGQIWVLWIVPIVLLVLAGFFTYLRYRQGKNAELVLGLLCITAVIAALVVGVYAQSRSLNEYYWLGRGASYYNVLPSEDAATKLDATTLVFSNTAMVDTSRTYGFVDASAANGRTYCVAPVSDGTAPSTLSTERVQYWVAGTDCCESRSNFQCSGSEAGAHGALRLSPDLRRNIGFVDAVHGAERAYNLQAGENFMLLRWVADPVAYRNNLFRNSGILFGIFAAVYLIISVMAGCALMPQVKQAA